MIRFAVILLASPAYAATLPAVQIEECIAISAKDMARDAVERVDVCRWPGPFDNPLPYDALADLKGPHEIPAPPVRVVPGVHAAVSSSLSGGTVRALGGVSSHSLASASSFSSVHVHTWDCPCGCCDNLEPEPSPVPIPAPAGLLISALIALGIVRRAKKIFTRQ